MPQPSAPFNPVTVVGPDGNYQGVDSLGHADIIAHAHSEGGHISFERDISLTQDFVLIDISDTTNYPHSNTGWVHLANMIINIDATADADYTLDLGFLEDIDGTNADFHSVYRVSGTKKAGVNHDISIVQNPEAPKLEKTRFLGKVTSDVTAFNTGTNLATTRDPSTADTPPGQGDMVLRATRVAGSLSLTVLVGYHTHNV